ncbi:MAG: LamG-like jellyroll fold domain-containing protein [bacterium]
MIKKNKKPTSYFLQTNRGFTFIELLIVIFIISLLSQIIYASLNSAREKARMAANILFEASVLHSIGDRLVGEWKFDQPAVNSKTADTSGYGNDGIINNPIYEAIGGYDRKGVYMFTNQNNQFIDIGNKAVLDLSKLSSFTESVWINTNGLSNRVQFIINKFVSGSILLRNNSLEFGGFSNPISPNKIPINKWVYIAIVYNGSNLLFYVNGVLDFKTSVSGNLILSSVTFISSPGNGFLGKIDSVRIYSSSLTAMDIKNIYAKESPHYQDLTMWSDLKNNLISLNYKI